MSRRDETEPQTHEATLLVLPWLASGTLDAAQAARAERHLESCSSCRTELDAERRLRTLVRDAADVAPAPHPVQLSRLWERIDAEEREIAPRHAAEGRLRKGSRSARLSRGWRWFFVGQVAAMLALGALLIRAREAPPPATFRTLAASLAAPAEDRGRRLRVVFTDSLDQRRLREILLPLDAEIVAGPSPLGVYTLSLPEKPGGEPVAWVVAHLRALPEVRFVEPVRANESH